MYHRSLTRVALNPVSPPEARSVISIYVRGVVNCGFVQLWPAAVAVEKVGGSSF